MTEPALDNALVKLDAARRMLTEAKLAKNVHRARIIDVSTEL